MNKQFRGLRIITNLHCNYKCKFCYQKNKQDIILSVFSLVQNLVEYKKKYFEYCTIMGGESTLLDNLTHYIEIGNNFSKETRLTTNGSLLSAQSLEEYKRSGLTGLNISIATLKHYKETTDGVAPKLILKTVEMAKEVFPNLRINIALCKENMSGEIKELLDLFIDKMNLNVTICEDILKTYSCVDDFKGKLNSEFIENTGHGLIFLSYKGKRFGYYTHDDNYKNEDLIISPYGVDVSWTGFCEKIGMNVR